MFSIEKAAGQFQEQGGQTQEQLKAALRELEQRCAALERDLDHFQADAGSLRRLEEHARRELEQKASVAAASAAEARAGLAQFRRQAAIEREQREQAQALVTSLQSELVNVRMERSAILASLSWRVTRPLRAASHAVPAPLKKLAGRGLKIAWWSLTFRLGTKLRERRATGQIARVTTALPAQPQSTTDVGPQSEVELLAESPLFDSKWYYAQYRDIAAANLDPIDHYLRVGAAEGRNPGPNFDGNWYLDEYPDVAAAGHNPLVHYLQHGIVEKREIRRVQIQEKEQHWSTALDELGDEINLHQALQTRYKALLPLRTFRIPKTKPRVTMTTDGIGSKSLYGGVGTALILAALLAERMGASLRLITRIESADPASFRRVLSVNGIEWNDALEFMQVRATDEREVSVSDNDFFLTTSWWGTRSALGAVNPKNIVYLLQEDERMFYPFGDDRLRCEETLSSPDITFVVNSELLFEHLTTGPEALANIRRNGIFFEPAFPESHYYPAAVSRPSGSKRNFFFYARPFNERNLYWRGLEAIGAAIENNILCPEDWNLYFVGRSIKPISLPRGVDPQIIEDLSWSEYAALLRSIDLGLCLMDTPHPSYPPLDLAACGAVVVTNTRGIKTSLHRYSDNILCANPSAQSLADAIGTGIKMACNETVRFGNYSRNKLLRDWRSALHGTVQQLASILQEKEI